MIWTRHITVTTHIIHYTWGLAYHKQVSRAGKSNYIPQIVWDVITCPCPWHMILLCKPSYGGGGRTFHVLPRQVESLKCWYTIYVVCFGRRIYIDRSSATETNRCMNIVGCCRFVSNGDHYLTNQLHLQRVLFRNPWDLNDRSAWH